MPELKYNIVCGNSLIGPDIFDQGTLFGDEERDRINAFDWHAVAQGPPSGPADLLADRRTARANSLEKPQGWKTSLALPSLALPSIGQVMREGGFDCIIGNPPYIRIQYLKVRHDRMVTLVDRMLDLNKTEAFGQACAVRNRPGGARNRLGRRPD